MVTKRITKLTTDTTHSICRQIDGTVIIKALLVHPDLPSRWGQWSWLRETYGLNNEN